MKAAKELETNPEAAVKKYSTSRPEFLEALRELASIIGDQLIKTADEQDLRTKPPAISKKPEIPTDIPRHEQELLKRVLNDPAIMGILAEPTIQSILLHVRQNPPEIGRIMRESDQETLNKIQTLIECGLLQVQN